MPDTPAEARLLVKRAAAVLFDLDGTLLDSVPDLAAAVDHALLQLGYPQAGESAVRTWVGNGAAALLNRALSAARGVSTVAADDRQLLALGQAFRAHYGLHCLLHSRPYPGAEALLQTLHAEGKPLALVTNKPLAFTEQILQGLDWHRLFAVVLGGDSLITKKPDPTPLRTACELLGAHPAAALMVGDSVNDIDAARACGMPVLAVSYGYNHGRPVSAHQPDALVDSLAGLA